MCLIQTSLQFDVFGLSYYAEFFAASIGDTQNFAPFLRPFANDGDEKIFTLR